MKNTEPRKEIHTEMSMLEHEGFKCPKCGASLLGRQCQKVYLSQTNFDAWEKRISCSCGDVVVAIND